MENEMPAEDLTFLVVEDHDFQRNVLVRMLGGMGAHAVHAAQDGRQALAVLKGLPSGVDVIISDLDMPTMDGMEFIRHIGLQHSGASLIIVSAVERGVLYAVESMANAYGINFLGTIEKPVAQAALERVIAAHRSDARARSGGKRDPAFTLEEILEGLDNNEFEPFFQPKVEIGSRRVIGAEALARWRHPELGIVGPDAFVKPLEEGGQIDVLTRRILTKGEAFARTLCAENAGCCIAVNLSIKSLVNVGAAEQITDIVRHQDVPTSAVLLEITESAATTEIAKVLENLARLRLKGFELSIDDYGTGYSSLEQLARIPFRELKIDRSFVNHAATQETTRVIHESSQQMASQLHLRTVAEGVEAEADWDLLRDLKCGVAQGYYISRPLSESTFLDWLARWNSTHRAQGSSCELDAEHGAAL
jgi:EAL domain-containing protein (putative c-di-GMP-specific phosphodiesterase class I)/AmiR/NasT family two-component response regulator